VTEKLPFAPASTFVGVEAMMFVPLTSGVERGAKSAFVT
jgi:hypothetical protein